MKKLTHVDETGRAQMVDVSAKQNVLRRAKASGRIRLAPATVALIKENKIKKGDVLTVAEIAGIQAAKQTSQLIPLCHPLPVCNISVKAKLETEGVSVIAEVSYIGQTGVEMEALTAASVALLTIYDMCKAADKNMEIEKIVLLEKTKNAP